MPSFRALVGKFEFLQVVQSLDSFLPLHSLCPRAVLLEVDEPLRLMHPRVPGTLAFHVKADSPVQVFRVTCVDVVAFAENNVNVKRRHT